MISESKQVKRIPCQNEEIKVSESPLNAASFFNIDDFDFDMTLPVMHEESLMADDGFKDVPEVKKSICNLD